MSPRSRGWTLFACALLAAMSSVTQLYASDHADGSLEQMLLRGQGAVIVVAAAKAGRQQQREPTCVVFGNDDGGPSGGEVQCGGVHAAIFGQRDSSDNLKD